MSVKLIKYLLTGICLWNMLACNTPTEETLGLTLVDSTVFETGMSSSPFLANTYYDKANRETLYYFVDEVTEKKVKVFSKQKGLVEEIPLDALTIYECEIDNVNLISLDTVIALCSYNNLLIFLNRKGNVWKTLSLDSLLSADGSNYFLSASRNFILSNNDLLFYNGWLSFVDDTVSREASLNYYKHTFLNIWRRAVLVKVSNVFSTKPQIQRGFKLFQQISPEDSTDLMFDSRTKYCIEKEGLWSISYFADKIYELDTKTLQLEKVLDLKSSSPKLGSEITKINTKTVDPNDRTIEKNLNRSRVIFELHYNTHLEHFYIVQLKELPTNTGEFNPNRPWILEIYDRSMKRLLQHEFDAKKYKRVLFPTTKGLMIEKKTPFVKYHDQKAVFHEFIY